ncbi:MAG: prolyl oligopeptidase family serine peptidase, partial [Candidatus Acidiferrales bacterium]
MLRRAIHSLERNHWARETRRVTHPFAWGIEHLGGDPALQDDDARSFLRRYADHALQTSDDFFSAPAADGYQFDGETLTYPSAIRSAYPENNLVTARWFPAAESRNGRGREKAAVVVLPQWNAQPDSHVNICRVLARFGLSALRLSLPYHDHRMPAGLQRADYMVCPNIGLTLQASHQAVLDVRRALRWLEQQGYTRLGILGTSIGSSVAFITLAHEPALRAFVGLHVSTYVADVVRTGLTTAHVWAGLEGQVSEDELRHYWSPVSPFPYVARLRGAGKKMLLVSARYDLSFPPRFSRQLWQALDSHAIPHELLQLPCGHYTLG